MPPRRHRTTILVAVLLLAGCAGALDRPGAPAPAGCGAEVPGFTRHVAELPGARIHYAVGGRGPTVVLVHGFPETWRVWRQVATRLADRFTVVLPDLRGVGCSSPEPAGYDAATRAEDLHHLVRQVRPGPVAVVGHDLGGMVAYAWARTHRDEVTRLVVAGAGIPGFGLAELAPQHVARFAADPDGVAAETEGRERSWLAAFTASPAFAASGALDDAVAAYSRPGRMRLAMQPYRELDRDAGDNRRAPTAPLSIPVTALEGGAPGISSATLPRVARSVRTVVIPGAGHYALVEQPGRFADSVSDALRGAPEAAAPR